jgi:16S rRNA (guanine966-N2)-methyltransferase
MVPGESTRPIGDRVKESLFNIIGPEIEGSRFLDLFAGTGSVGIEALSRGAGSVLFNDSDIKAIRTIRENLRITGLEEGAEVRQNDAISLLGGKCEAPFEYIYIAPPQYQSIWLMALHAVDGNPVWMAPDAWVIVQIHPREYQSSPLTHLQEFDQRKYGNTLLVFYEYPGE